MKESVGYTLTLNIVFVFIVIVFSFLSAALIYFKSNKVSNLIIETIEKNEGYNVRGSNEIDSKITSLGYNKKPVNCRSIYNQLDDSEKNRCSNSAVNDGSDGYCVFLCREEYMQECYYYYKVSTNMMINIPIINDILDIPIFSNTNRMYDFENQSC